MKNKQRNLLATAPLLKKGGVHLTETSKAQNKRSRKLSKQDLKSQKWI